MFGRLYIKGYRFKSCTGHSAVFLGWKPNSLSVPFSSQAYINGYQQTGKLIGDIVEKLQWTYVKFIIEEKKILSSNILKLLSATKISQLNDRRMIVE